jgi:UDP-N-acetyl-D-glucosamine dehydrogenase
LLEKIHDRSAVVGVIGLGYVGLPLASAMTRAGYPVYGFDVDQSKIDALGAGKNYIGHLGDAMVREMLDTGRFTPTVDFANLGRCDVAIICVPTPLGDHKEPDLQFVESSARAIAATLRKGQLVVLESTTYPGTTRDVVGGILREAGEAAGLEASEDYLVAFSPERQDPGREAGGDVKEIPKLVGGTCSRSGEAAHALYSTVLDQVTLVESAEVAEAAKLLENVFRSVNIALVNEMKVILDAMGIDVWKVIEAAATKPFGFMKFTPGPGLGGHCIPVDPFYLTWAARRFGHATRFIELAGEINTQMPDYVVNKTMLALNQEGRALRGSRVLVLGMAYKPNVDDVRESPAVTLIERFAALGADVQYSDPHVPIPPRMREHDLSAYRSQAITPESIASYDAVVVATDHAAFDWALIADHAKVVVDTRNALASRSDRISRYVRA